LIGIDLVDAADAADLASPRMRERIFAPGELALRELELLTAFAAKEALLKSLGWGLDAGVGRFAEIEVCDLQDGILTLRAHGRTRRELRKRRVCPAAIAFEAGDARGAVVVLAPSPEAASAILPQLRAALRCICAR
jgi:phosphopantetheinyl transferase (holo-ACP synthase)